MKMKSNHEFCTIEILNIEMNIINKKMNIDQFYIII